MNKEYTVTFADTEHSYLDYKEFDDLLKMWEFVIQLKSNPTIGKIWVDTSQLVFEREG